jgi:DNA-binding NarL/FixJ family response regulator
MIRLLVVDDHEASRKAAIAGIAGGDMFEVIAEAEASDEAWQKAKQLLPDMVLLDLHLPGLISTPDLIKRLINLKNVKVIAFASEGKASEVQDLLDYGASAYVLKTDAPALIRMTLLMVSRGSRNVISPSLPRHLTRLTFDERNILRHITKRGGTVKAAERMGISAEVLEETLLHLCEKLDLEDSDQLTKWAKKHEF